MTGPYVTMLEGAAPSQNSPFIQSPDEVEVAVSEKEPPHEATLA